MRLDEYLDRQNVVKGSPSPSRNMTAWTSIFAGKMFQFRRRLRSILIIRDMQSGTLDMQYGDVNVKIFAPKFHVR